jgi:phage portal protein BeeE
MLLGIPGDNTYANYQEASRGFWRNTVLPLASRSLKALAGANRAPANPCAAFDSPRSAIG